MPTALYDIINLRRDVRGQFVPGVVEPDVLMRILGAAHAAPSVGLTQPWDFILVRDIGVRRLFQQHVQQEREIFAATLAPDRAQVFRAIKIEGILQAAMGVVVTYDAGRGSPGVLGRHAIADAGLYSTCLAIQNLWLAATAEDIGVGWVSFYREQFLQELLDIPQAIRPIAWLCVGPISALEPVPDLEAFGWRSRRPLHDAIHEGRYRARPEYDPR